MDLVAEELFGYARGSYMHGLINQDLLSYEYEVSSLVIALGIQWSRWNFIDVGANIGYFPVILKSLFGESVSVDAFEAHPSLAAMCSNGMSGWQSSAKTHQIALSRESGSAKFYLSAKTDSSNSLNSRFRPHKQVIDVRVSTLDDIFFGDAELTMFEPQNPTILKIDVESTEPDVLAGGQRFIEVQRPHIICEVLAGRTEDQINDFCSKNSYTPIRLTKHAMHVEREVYGDPSYEFRDWYLSPSELNLNIERNFILVSTLNSLSSKGADHKQPVRKFLQKRPMRTLLRFKRLMRRQRPD